VTDLHEWALAEGVIDTILDKFDLSEKKILEVDIVLGELQQIDVEVFKFALRELSKDSPLKDAKFNIMVEKAEFKCNVCGYIWGFGDILKKLGFDESESIHFLPETVHAFASCPKCGSRDFKIVRGRGIYLKKVKILEK